MPLQFWAVVWRVFDYFLTVFRRKKKSFKSRLPSAGGPSACKWSIISFNIGFLYFVNIVVGKIKIFQNICDNLFLINENLKRLIFRPTSTTSYSRELWCKQTRTLSRAVPRHRPQRLPWTRKEVHPTACNHTSLRNREHRTQCKMRELYCHS